MNSAAKTYRQLTDEAVDLRIRLAEASDTLRAIQGGEVDAVLVQGPQGNQLFTLKGADDPYRVLIEEMNQGAVTLSADGSILYCNRRFADLLKMPLESIVGFGFETFVALSECAGFAALLKAGRSGASAGEITLCASDASAVPLQLALGPLPADSAAAICLIATDISERKRADEQKASALRELNTVRAAIDEHAIVAITDRSGKITYVNEKFCAISKYSRAELIGQDHRIINSGYHPKQFMRDMWMTISAGRVWKGEIKNKAKDGTFYWVDSTITPYLGADGKPIQYIAIRADITERREKETRLRETMADLVAAERESRAAQQEARHARENAEQANHAKDNFLANLSHELRTPLTPVLMCVADLEQERAIAPEFRLQLAMVRRNVELEARLIDDLLDLTMVAHGKLQIVQSGPVDIHALLMHTEQIVHSDALAKSVRFQFELKACEHHVGGDAARLHQVFWNLFKNAIKFTPKGGCITIRTGNPAPGQIVLGVNDTGMGIDAETLPFVFNAFEQGETRKLQVSGGLGLGLSISKAIVELHGGTIRAESPGPGLGATLIIEFATVLPFPIPHLIEAKPASQAQPHCRRLLVIEDHEPTLTILAHLLRRRGHDVLTASTVKGALSLAANHTFDLVISDIGLPDGTGIDLMRQLTKDYGLGGIALSGYGMPADHAKSREAGFLAHLVKPINFDQLHNVLQGIAPVPQAKIKSAMSG
jgi:PAS domain S-box-containing protein